MEDFNQPGGEAFMRDRSAAVISLSDFEVQYVAYLFKVRGIRRLVIRSRT
jgi:hypothetical protein